VNWLEPMAKGLTEHLLAGLLLSVGTIVPFLVVRPLLINARRGRAATSQRILSLLFLVLAISPISSGLELFRSRSENVKSQPSVVAEPSRGTDQFVAHEHSKEQAAGPSEHQGSFAWLRIASGNWPILLAVIWAMLVSLLLTRLLLAVSALDPSSTSPRRPIAAEYRVPPQNCFSRVTSYPRTDGDRAMVPQGGVPFKPLGGTLAGGLGPNFAP
jgi:hypothetical protein